jgi:hypothetical protein
MTKRGIATAVAVALMLGGVSFASQKDQTFTGEITDNQCAKMGSHQAMMKSMNIKTSKECALGCVKGGGKFVLFNAATKTVYQLDDQRKPEQFAAEKVVVIGALNKDTGTIHVTDIKRVP